MTFNLTPESELEPARAAARAKAEEERRHMRTGLIGLAVILALLVWGGFALTSCVSNALSEGREKRLAEDALAAKQAVIAPVGDAPAAPANDAGYSDTTVQAAAMSAVKRKLADDRSARFRNVSVVTQPSGTKAVCGEVNAKNRAGGYNGYQHFISAGTDQYTWLEEEMPDFASAWNQLCVK